MSKRSELEWACLEMQAFKSRRRPRLSDSFLRRPYAGTSAEPRDDAQEKLHEYDWLKY